MDFVALALGFAAGLVAGVLYLVALWFTVKRAARTGDRSLLVISFLARAAVLLLAFYGLRGLGVQGLIAALIGFIAARWLMTRILGPERTPDASPASEPGGEVKP